MILHPEIAFPGAWQEAKLLLFARGLGIYNLEKRVENSGTWRPRFEYVYVEIWPGRSIFSVGIVRELRRRNAFMLVVTAAFVELDLGNTSSSKGYKHPNHLQLLRDPWHSIFRLDTSGGLHTSFMSYIYHSLRCSSWFGAYKTLCIAYRS